MLAKKKGQPDIFSADTHEPERQVSLEEVKQQWMAHFPTVGSELQVDAAVMADLIEHSDFLLSEYLLGIGELMEMGVIQNTQARGHRTRFPVNFKKRGELLRRLK